MDVAKPKIARHQLEQLSEALEIYINTQGRVPTTNEGLQALLVPIGGAWPLLPAIPVDPWGAPFVYSLEEGERGLKYRIASLGPDGIAGTEDDIVVSYDVAVRETGARRGD